MRPLCRTHLDDSRAQGEDAGGLGGCVTQRGGQEWGHISSLARNAARPLSLCLTALEPPLCSWLPLERSHQCKGSSRSQQLTSSHTISHPSVHPTTCLGTHADATCIPDQNSIHPSVCPPINLPTVHPFCPPICPSTHLSLRPSIHPTPNTCPFCQIFAWSWASDDEQQEPVGPRSQPADGLGLRVAGAGYRRQGLRPSARAGKGDPGLLHAEWQGNFSEDGSFTLRLNVGRKPARGLYSSVPGAGGLVQFSRQ